MRDSWISVHERLPEEGEEVRTKIDDTRGERNIARLTMRGRLWYAGSMYVYYTSHTGSRSRGRAMIDLVQAARFIASVAYDRQAHAHARRVAQLVPERLAVPALLHDIVEDTEVTNEQIEALFGPDVGDLVDILTRREGESYDSYIRTVIAGGPDAIAIKLADIQDHFDQADTLTDSLRKRYEKARASLETAL